MQLDPAGKSARLSGVFLALRGVGGSYCMRVRYWPDQQQRPDMETGFLSGVYI